MDSMQRAQAAQLPIFGQVRDRSRGTRDWDQGPGSGPGVGSSRRDGRNLRLRVFVGSKHVFLRVSLAALWLGASATLGAAAPIVAPKGQPSAVTSWQTTGKQSTTLVIDAGFSAEAVAAAIVAKFPRAAVKSSADKVIVSKVVSAELIKALEQIEVDPLGDDIDAMLVAMQFPGAEGSGSSIRATKHADFASVMGEASEQIGARVLEVRRERFPLVFIKVQVEHIPSDREGVGLRPGQRITVLPRVKSKNGLVDPEDQASKLNVGAWYAQPGDRVRLRLEEKRRQVWIAQGFERLALPAAEAPMPPRPPAR